MWREMPKYRVCDVLNLNCGSARLGVVVLSFVRLTCVSNKRVSLVILLAELPEFFCDVSMRGFAIGIHMS